MQHTPVKKSRAVLTFSKKQVNLESSGSNSRERKNIFKIKKASDFAIPNLTN